MSTSSPEDQQRLPARTVWSSLVDMRFDEQRDLAETGAHAITLQEADVELQVMQESLLLARRRRNSMASVLRFPEELLCRIFGYLQASWEPARWRMYQEDVEDWEARSSALTRYTSGWMAVTHVCSTWRQTSINDPALWCAVDCRHVHPRSLDTILARAKGRMLDITSSLYADPFESRNRGAEVSLNAATCARIEKLDLSVIGWESENEDIVAPLSSELPNLLELKLSFLSDELPPGNVLTTTYPPKLMLLDVTDYPPPPDSTLLSHTLTSLKLRYSSAATYTLTITHLSQILSVLPNLQTCGLENVLCVGLEDEALQPFSVPSSLRVLTVVSSANDAMEVLTGHAVIPSSASVMIDLHTCVSPDAGLLVARNLFDEANLDQTRAQELILKDRCVRLCPWYLDGSQVWVGSDLRSPDFTIDTVNPIGYRVLRITDIPSTGFEEVEETDTVEDIRLYLRYLPLQSVTAIAFDIFHRIGTADSWIANFSSARNVMHIYCMVADRVSDDFIGLCAALDSFDGQEFALFPRLKTITISFEGQPSLCERSHPHFAIVALTSVLKSRRLNNAPMQEVHVERFLESLLEEEWDEIRTLVELSSVRQV
ncbi:unnamed protein product [Peniophora sp. CBMAI 1063]|nr:unnamed protein product [Peniophora sp. CBMAI 1063]